MTQVGWLVDFWTQAPYGNTGDGVRRITALHPAGLMTPTCLGDTSCCQGRDPC
jgi:hypothetical protein